MTLRLTECDDSIFSCCHAMLCTVNIMLCTVTDDARIRRRKCTPDAPLDPGGPWGAHERGARDAVPRRHDSGRRAVLRANPFLEVTDRIYD